ncbi:DUF1904 domain-containing protein [Marinobacterium arenosum]|uniref:DUF1904 domain-containing protein n=1 Tax=Marinobacterium arenosum TaxID=2862496 RepID=UPI001C964C4B|nr:DUF1904 domain-containing protein [Marinobacterium arenosum]MBY4678936.1 DUF1904 domain-containing protein [Marinobacterium arenosum]
MPQIRLRGVDADKARQGSTELVDQLAKLLDTPRDYFTIEVVNSTFIADGEFSAGYPFVEVLWFDRGLEAQDRCAELITRYLQQLGYADVDLWFTRLDGRNYYENGQHFG